MDNVAKDKLNATVGVLVVVGITGFLFGSRSAAVMATLIAVGYAAAE